MRILSHPATLVFLLILVVVLFGYKRLPDVAKSVGQSMKIFKSEIKTLNDDAPATPATPAAPDVTAQNTTAHNATAPANPGPAAPAVPTTEPVATPVVVEKPTTPPSA